MKVCMQRQQAVETIQSAPGDAVLEALVAWLDKAIFTASTKQRNAFNQPNDRLGERYYARHCALLDVKQQIEALTLAHSVRP